MPITSDTPAPLDQTRLMAGLTRSQGEAAGMQGSVLVLAGAGTGKIKTLTAGVAMRIAKRGIPAQRILAVTFTNKAAGEMRERIVALLGGQAAPSWIGTFHSLGARQLRQEPEMAGLRENFDVLDADDSRRLLKRIMKAMGSRAGGDEDMGKDPVKAIAGHIGRFKDNLITPGDAIVRAEAMIATNPMADASGLRAAARIYPEYQRQLREANAADFGDLLLWPTVTMGQDEECRQRFAGRFSCLLADEYQDVNASQYRWLRLMAADHNEIFAVGDDDQCVFGWRGADIEHIRRFTRDFRGAAVVKLEENFRSTGHILAAANAVIAHDETRLGKTLRSTREQGQPIEVMKFRNDETEAIGIAAEIRKRGAEDVRWQDIAILHHARWPSKAAGDGDNNYEIHDPHRLAWSGVGRARNACFRAGSRRPDPASADTSPSCTAGENAFLQHRCWNAKTERRYSPDFYERVPCWPVITGGGATQRSSDSTAEANDVMRCRGWNT